MLEPACSHMHRHRFHYYSGRLIVHQHRFPSCVQRLLVQKIKNAKSYSCMQPQASSSISLLFWAALYPDRQRHIQNTHRDTQSHGDTNRCIARKMWKSTLMPVAARSQMQHHRFPYSSGRHIAHKSKDIYADACRRMQPQASTYISVLFWAMHCPDKQAN